MMFDPKTEIVDRCLEEVLGGQSPPDLSGRILAALDERGTNEHKRCTLAEPVAPPVQGVSCEADFGGSSPCVEVRRSERTRRSPVWAGLAIAASLLIAAFSIAFLTRGDDREGSVAKTPRGTSLSTIEVVDGKHRERDLPPVIKDGHLVESPRRDPLRNDRTPGPGPNREAGKDIPQVAKGSLDSERPASSDREVVELVNWQLRVAAERRRVKPSPLVGEREWAERLFATILGRRPSHRELKEFGESIAEDKRSELVDALLTDRKYRREFEARWAAKWTDVLIGPTDDSGTGLANRDGLRQYLRSAIASDQPLNQVAYELIAATGSGSASSPSFNGAANFLLHHLDDHAIAATEATSRVFLGKRLDCARCHDQRDGRERLAQREFWEMNAFLRQMDIDRDEQSGTALLVNKDFVGEGTDPRDAEIYYETPDGQLKVAFPSLNGVAISTSGLVDDVDRRNELAKLVVEAPLFPRAMINQSWKLVFGYGLAKDVMASDSDEVPELDDLLGVLASEFVAGNYDMKKVVKWAVLSDAFARQTTPLTAGGGDSPELGQRALFTRFYAPSALRQPVRQSLATAVKARIDGDSVSTIIIGRATEQVPPSKASTQGLFVPVTPTLVESQFELPMVERLLRSSLSQQQQAEHVFIATLGRTPNRGERSQFEQLLQASNGDHAEALRALWLVLSHSSESVVNSVSR